jgi:hypothetical protein
MLSGRWSRLHRDRAFRPVNRRSESRKIALGGLSHGVEWLSSAGDLLLSSRFVYDGGLGESEYGPQLWTMNDELIQERLFKLERSRNRMISVILKSCRFFY